MGLEDELLGFTGSTIVYRHWSKFFVYTEGTKYLAEQAGAYWLIDAIASYQPQFQSVSFQVWDLLVQDNKQAVLTMQEDEGEPVLVRQPIQYTDFALNTVRLFVVNKVLMLPGEY